eukprot:135892-Prorocentrum_minimum.AAC.1
MPWYRRSAAHVQIGRSGAQVRTRVGLRRYGLTGTAMQNTFDELWCLMEWATPGSLGQKKAFKDYYAKAIQFGQRIDAPTRTHALGERRREQVRARGRKI